jgi:hypothetical protein
VSVNIQMELGTASQTIEVSAGRGDASPRLIQIKARLTF